MNYLLQLLDVDTVFFTIFNYPMSYVEFFGTLLNIACVWLLTKKNIISWPVGILAVILFGALFYQLNLYADLFEQAYYLVTGFLGWFAWAKTRKKQANDEQDKNDIVVRTNTVVQNITWGVGITAFTVLGAWAMARIHLWLPSLFPEPASLPLLDVFTTVLSFAAQAMLIQKRLENWMLWIVVDIIGIGLYWHKQVPFVALLYVIFLGLATQGFVTWYKTYQKQKEA